MANIYTDKKRITNNPLSIIFLEIIYRKERSNP